MSDSPRDLTIQVKLDKSQAKASAAGLRSDLRQVNQQVNADAEKARAEDLAGARSAAEKKKALHAEAAASIKRTTKAAADDAGEAFKNMGGVGALALGGMTSAAGIATVAMGKLQQAAQLVADAYKEVAARQKELGEKALSTLEMRAELAALKGVKEDSKFAANEGAIAGRTFQTPEEAVRGQVAFRNEGAQHIGKTISEEEAQKAYEATARYATRRNVDRDAVGALTGQTIGSEDFTRFGDKAGAVAGARTTAMTAVLGAGSGKESHLIGELGKIRSTVGGKGGILSDEDASIMTSLLAEVSPGQEAESARAAVKAVRDMGGKGGKFLKGAGVKLDQPIFEQLDLIKTALEAEAEKRGGGATRQDVARDVFTDIQGANAISGLTGKLDQVQGRRKVFGSVTPEGMAQEDRDFLGTPRGSMRATAAAMNATEEQKGQEQATVELQRRAAKQGLEASGEFDGIGQALRDKAEVWYSLFQRDPKRDREIAYQQETMLARMPADMAERHRNAGIPLTDVGANAMFQGMNRDMQGRGVNALNGVREPGAPAAPAAEAPAAPGILDQVVKSLAKLVGAEMGRGAPPQGPRPPFQQGKAQTGMARPRG